MTLNTDELNKELLRSREDLTPKQIDFAFAKMDIEKEYLETAMVEIEAVVRKYSKLSANSILELAEKYFKEKEDD